MKKAIAIAGIHTNIGKTIASAVIAEAIGADYWKPVQAGKDERDAELLKKLLTNGQDRVYNEAVILSQPLSPHTAAEIDNVEVDYKKFEWPKTDKILLVETAGGLLSPMSADATMADFIAYYNLPVILVSLNYLGSINHTLLTIEVLRSRGITVNGLIMNGLENESSENFITAYSDMPIIARIPYINDISNDGVRRCAMQLKPLLLPLLS
jgi:dethiobiotin synthetase